MLKMSYPKIVAFVEGTMERVFINNNFPYVLLIPLPNGTSWTIARVLEFIVSALATRDEQFDFYMVWMDREGREETSQTMSDFLRLGVEAVGVERERLLICIPDTMTENVILSDTDLIREAFGDPFYKYSSEGLNGKKILSNMFKQKGVNYKEVRDGVPLLKKMRLNRCCSPAVAGCAEGLYNIAENCWWTHEG